MSTDDALATYAGIEYTGQPGASADCVNGLLRILQFGDVIASARLLTCDGSHGLLLTIGVGDEVAVKCGFTSNHRGEGSNALSYVLMLLHSHSVEIEEYDVPYAVLERLDASALLRADLETLREQRPVRPTRWREYIRSWHEKRATDRTLWDDFPPAIPFAVLDPRLIDLALFFWEAPDARLLTAYRRLEDIVRERIGSNEHSGKLFASAFAGEKAVLKWATVRSAGESAGRAELFRATFNAYRNPRAHRAANETNTEKLAEFLLINQLYRLERQAERSTDLAFGVASK